MIDFSSGELDEAFAQHVIAIRAHAARLGSRHEKIRIQKWLTALSSPTQHLVWKKNRNQHSVCLAEMLARGKMEAPFTQMPTVPLQNFPAHLVARYSSLQGSLSSALLRASPAPAGGLASPPSLHLQDAGASANAEGVARAQSRVASEVGPLSTPASRPAGVSGAHRSRVDQREEFQAHDVPNPGTEHGETSGRVSAAEGSIMQPLSIHQIMKMTNAELVARLVKEQALRAELEALCASYKQAAANVLDASHRVAPTTGDAKQPETGACRAPERRCEKRRVSARGGNPTQRTMKASAPGHAGLPQASENKNMTVASLGAEHAQGGDRAGANEEDFLGFLQEFERDISRLTGNHHAPCQF